VIVKKQTTLKISNNERKLNIVTVCRCEKQTANYDVTKLKTQVTTH